MIENDIEFLKRLLPFHYEIKESKKIGSVHCKSAIGIVQSPYVASSGILITDAEDEKQWAYIFSRIETHFGNRFQEVFHNTCSNHIDFTVYLRAVTPAIK